MNIIQFQLLFLAAFLASLILTPLFIRLAHSLKIVDHPAHRKIHTQTIAYMGGVALFTSILVVLGVFVLLTGGLSSLDTGEIHKVLYILIPSLGVMFLGLWDDAKDLRPRYKLIGQVILASIFALYGYRFEVLHIPGLPPIELGLLSVPLTVFWIVSIINAFNMIDGVDGLSASVSLITLFMIAATAAFLGNRAESVLCLVAGAVVLGFLFYNWKPARIYLGDAGSGGLGMFIAVSLVALGHQESYWMRSSMGYPVEAFQPYFYQLFIVTLFLAYPSLEITSSVARRLVHGRPIGRADKGHIHHRLLDLGITAKIICLIVGAFTLLVGLAALAIIAKHNGKAAWLLGFSGLILGIGLSYLKFLNFLDPKSIQHRKPHFQVANHFIEMQKIKLGLASSREDVLALVAQTCDEFGVKNYHMVIPADREGRGGLDYAHKWEPTRQLHLGFLKPNTEDGGVVFSDRCRMVGNKGGVQWAFEPNSEEEDLDVEYRVLVHEFMKDALGIASKLGEDKDTLEMHSMAIHENRAVQSHALRKRHQKASKTS